MITQRFDLPLETIKTLFPAFCNGYGWLSIEELNLIDPNADRFVIVEMANFIDNSIFVNVVPDIRPIIL